MAYGNRRRGRRLASIPAWIAGSVARYGYRKAVAAITKYGAKRTAIAAGGLTAGGVAANTYAYGKRKASGPIDRKKKSRRVATANVNQASEFGRALSVRGGRLKRTTVGELSALSLFKRILRWQRVNGMNRVAGTTIPGAMPMPNRPAADGQTTVCPVHFYELTSSFNNSTTVTPVNYNLVCNDNGTVTFTNLPPKAPDGNDSSNTEWVFEYRSDPAAILTARRYIKQEWFDIRMLLYGCQAQPTKFEISIVQFRKDFLDPIEMPSSSQEHQDRQSFYHDVAQEMMYNPIMPKTGYKGKLRVLKKVVVTLQPTLSTQNDTTPASKPVRIFYAHEKICDYMYHSNSISGLNIDGALNTEKWAQDGVATADYSESPVAKQRVWLMVRALNTTPTTDETSANTPSYDIVIRKKESCIQG